MKDRIDYTQYDIFKGIAAENLDTLMTCMNAFLFHLGAGENIVMVPGKTALITGGSVSFVRNAPGRGAEPEMQDEEEILREGDLLGEGFLRSAEIKKAWTEDGCDMLVMSSGPMGTPCWWSCFFHSAFIDNLEKYRAEHS
jgi:hypothetical protein